MSGGARRAGRGAPFPYLSERDRFRFPDPLDCPGDIVAAGGNLSPGMLLSAYEQGIFPWYNEGQPVLWQSPDPRFVLYPENLHVSRSMEKTLRRGVFDIRFDTCFADVITACSRARRPGQSGTWITGDMIQAYIQMSALGYARCAEAWREGRLAGGCYGIRLGRVFFGESMFSREPDASKAAFITLARMLFAQGLAFIDCQVWTAHLESLGAVEVPRRVFLDRLRGEVAAAS